MAESLSVSGPSRPPRQPQPKPFEFERYLPYPSNDPLICSLKERAIGGLDWGCSSLGNTLLIHGLEAMINAKGARKRSCEWTVQYYKALTAFQKGATRLFAHLSACEIGRTLRTPLDKRDPLDEIEDLLHSARVELTRGWRSRVPAPITTAAHAILEIEEAVVSDPTKLLRPPGLRFDDPNFLADSLTRRWTLFDKVFNDPPHSMLSLWRSNQAPINEMLSTYWKAHRAISGPASLEEVKQLVAVSALIRDFGLRLMNQLPEELTAEESQWAALWNMLYVIPVSEAERFLMCLGSREAGHTAADMPKVGQTIQEIIEKTLKALSALGEGPFPSDSETTLADQAKVWIRDAEGSLQKTDLRMKAWTQACSTRLPPSDEPAILASYLARLGDYFDGGLHQAVDRLQDLLNTKSDTGLFWEHLHAQIRLLDDAQNLCSRHTYGECILLQTPMVKRRERRPKRDLSNANQPVQAAREATPLSEESDVSDIGPPSLADEPVDEVPNTADLERPRQKEIFRSGVWTHLQCKLRDLDGLDLIQPSFAGPFRKKWQVSSEATLRSTVATLAELEEHDETFDGMWCHAEKLHPLLEASLDRAFVHYPVGNSETHALQQPLPYNQSKALYQEHKLEVLITTLMRNDFPLQLKALCSKYYNFVKSFSRSNVILRYPLWGRQSLPERDAPSTQPLFELTTRLAHGLVTKQELIQDYAKPAACFVSDLLQLFKGKEVAGLDTASAIPSPVDHSDLWEVLEGIPSCSERESIKEEREAYPLPPAVTNGGQALRVLSYALARTDVLMQIPITGLRARWRLARRNEALGHAQLYLYRLREKLETGHSIQRDLYGSLDLLHSLMKELYVAAIAHAPAFPTFHQEHHLLELLVPSKGHQLRLEQNLAILHSHWRSNWQSEGAHLSPLLRSGPRQFGWPQSAHRLLSYYPALKEIGSLNHQSLSESEFCETLDALHQRQGSYEALRDRIDVRYRFPALDLISGLVTFAFPFSAKREL